MITQILTSTRNLLSSFSFNGAARGNNALVTVKDLQNVIQQINNQLYFRPIDFMLTHNNQANPTFKLLMAGATDCLGSCNCAGDCGCAGTIASPSCVKEAFPIINPSPTRIAVGVYHLTLAANHPDLVNRGIGVWVASLANVAHRITVSKIQNNVITISTYNAGVLDDTILDQTVFAMKLYVNK